MAERVGRVGRRGGEPEFNQDRDRGPEADGGHRRPVAGVAGLVSLAISGLVLYLAWWVLWDRSHPAYSVALEVQHGDAAARLKAIKELEQVGPEDPEVALPALITGLTDSNAKNRWAAIDAMLTVIQAVGGSGNAADEVGAAVSALLDRLADPDAAIRTRSTQALWTVVLLWHGSPRVINLDTVTDAFNRLADDPDGEVRVAAIRGLAVISQRISPEPPARLVAALEDQSEAIRMAAAQSIATFRGGLPRLLPTLVKSLESTRPECRPAYLQVLREIRPSTSDGAVPEEMVSSLIAATNTPDRELRRYVILLLGQFGPAARPVIPRLVSLLREPDEPLPAVAGHPPAGPLQAEPDTVVVAAEVLGSIARNLNDLGSAAGEPRAGQIAAALKELLRSPNAQRRAAAAKTLRFFEPDAGLLPALREAAGDRDESVRAAAVWTIHNYAQKLEFAMPRELSAALEDNSSEVRMAAASAVGQIKSGVEPMVPALIQHALNDPADEVRETCGSTLHRLRPPNVTAAVVPLYIQAIDSREASRTLRGELIDALTGFGGEARAAIPAVIRALDSSQGGERGTRSHTRTAFKRSAVQALGRLGPGSPFASDAIATLTDLVDDRNVGLAAVAELARFGPSAKAAAPRLVRVMQRASDRTSAGEAAEVADVVRAVAPGSPEEAQALAILREWLDAEPSLLQITRVIEVVGHFGPRAADALPRLREMSGFQDPAISMEARKAVATIEGSSR